MYQLLIPCLPSLILCLRYADSSKVSSVVQRVLAKILEMAGGLGGIKGLGRCDSMYCCACVRESVRERE
jgi:hypothetical protein